MPLLRWPLLWVVVVAVVVATALSAVAEKKGKKSPACEAKGLCK